MPLYDFKCDTCDHKETDMLVPNDNPIPCPVCAEHNKDSLTKFGMMNKQISMPARTSRYWGDTHSNRI